MAVLIQWGQLHPGCTAGKCLIEREPGAEDWMRCPRCHGRGCPACADKGQVLVTGCPHATIPLEVWDALRLFDYAEKGLPPMRGGSLDQTQWFIEAFELVLNLQDYYRAKFNPLQHYLR